MNIIVKSDGTLIFNKKQYRCALGKNGITADKKEGDETTPIGCFSMRKLFYRPDRFEKVPQTNLLVQALSKEDGWSNDVDSSEYNTFVKLPHNGSYEKLWRADNLYDLIVPIGYNDNPVVSGKGSAIFMHIARDGYIPTMGCVVLSRDDFLEILGVVDVDTKVCIQE
ncbi:MAG: L,D-transpeptidase family protein [bacterium]